LSEPVSTLDTPRLFQGEVASFAFDFRPIRRFAERDHSNIVSWSEFDRGGHWAAHDAPDLLVGDLRQFFRGLR
jgi:hypothetical protein